ncbi:hypothetical protein EVB41_067 [Rhizobium phage RHph_TM3_14A]|nr:hypothetical protein EVB29_067 [Rhizobium phage RHph_TM27A]QIG66987.1 hypothetical protein EVB30_067 [Rhizobium phage RHph_TM27B]QIG67076.1 hypothetical protein EVB31_066 [Rhizobium phage RHph_TM29]QIG67532.1 hypothetical protein EVB41_067 [Rhizobium phage RHph_TM3_14A]
MVIYANKAEQLKAEQEAGRRTVLKRSAEACVEKVQRRTGVRFKFVQGDQTTIYWLEAENGTRYTAEEFIAMAMLLGDE